MVAAFTTLKERVDRRHEAVVGIGRQINLVDAIALEHLIQIHSPFSTCLGICLQDSRIGSVDDNLFACFRILQPQRAHSRELLFDRVGNLHRDTVVLDAGDAQFRLEVIADEVGQQEHQGAAVHILNQHVERRRRIGRMPFGFPHQNDYARNRARLLASEGYVALAVNLYEQGQVASHPKDAKAFMEQALADTPGIPFRIPSGVDLVRIDADTGRPGWPEDAVDYDWAVESLQLCPAAGAVAD